jgi:hypothetical protein
VGPATLALVVASVVLVAWIWLMNRRGEPPVGAVEEPALDPEDTAELDRLFDEVTGDVTSTRDGLIAARMQTVIRRRVPVRVVEPVPTLRTSRVRFADGTTIVGHGLVAGDLGVLAAAVRDHSVRVTSCTRGTDGVHVAFDWPGHGLDIVVTGLDQPE